MASATSASTTNASTTDTGATDASNASTTDSNASTTDASTTNAGAPGAGANHAGTAQPDHKVRKVMMGFHEYAAYAGTKHDFDHDTICRVWKSMCGDRDRYIEYDKESGEWMVEVHVWRLREPAYYQFDGINHRLRGL